jgi:hypothetical protein
MRDIGDVALFGDEVSKVEELQSVGGGGGWKREAKEMRILLSMLIDREEEE